MSGNFEYDVFLSHSQADKPRVRPLAELLRAAGLRVWFDEWIIQPADNIPLEPIRITFGFVYPYGA